MPKFYTVSFKRHICSYKYDTIYFHYLSNAKEFYKNTDNACEPRKVITSKENYEKLNNGWNIVWGD